MPILQAIQDNLTRLNAAAQSVDQKVDLLLARPAADPNAASPAEQQTVADGIAAAAAALEATAAKVS